MKNETVTTNSIDLAFDSLNSCTAYIDHINTLIYRLIDEYQAGDSNKANWEQVLEQSLKAFLFL